MCTSINGTTTMIHAFNHEPPNFLLLYNRLSDDGKTVTIATVEFFFYYGTKCKASICLHALMVFIGSVKQGRSSAAWRGSPTIIWT